MGLQSLESRTFRGCSSSASSFYASLLIRADPATACAVSLALRCLKFLNTSDLPMAKATTCERPPTCGGYFACRSVSSEADSSEDRLAALAMDLFMLLNVHGGGMTY